VLDQEIAYAQSAGINYFIYNWAAPPPSLKPGPSMARLLHQRSAKRNLVKMAYLGFGGCLESCGSYPTPADSCREMKESYYQKVNIAGVARPLVFTWPVNAAREVKGLRDACRALGAGDPYVVYTDFNMHPEKAAAAANAQGADAVTSYPVVAGAANEPYENLAARGVRLLTDYETHAKRYGKDVVPFTTAGWDPRPIHYGGYGDQLTPPMYSETTFGWRIGQEVWNAARWSSMHAGGVSKARSSVIYAWNEFSEGGWLCPTRNPATGQPDIDRVLYVGKARRGGTRNFATAAGATARASSTLPGFSANAARDGNEATAWQCNQTSDCWLELAWPAPVTFDKIVLSEYGDRITRFSIEAWNGSAWEQIVWDSGADGHHVGPHRFLNVFYNKTTTRVRLSIPEAKDRPIIYELGVYRVMP
jgi:hypothetical protein